MLFKSRFHEGIRTGRITTTVRIWKRPHVRLDGRYALGDGAIVVDRIHEMRLEDITAAIARRSGFASVVDLLKTARHGNGERVFVIDFHYDGSGPAHPAPETSPPGAAELLELDRRLDAMDCRARAGAWTRETLRLIREHPGVPAAVLARELGRPRDYFKRDVRKLKALGLTISLEVGYRLSAKGEALTRCVSPSELDA
jgi:hypothetical protein